MKVVFQVPQDGQYGLDIYTRERFLNLKEMDIFNFSILITFCILYKR